MNHFLPTPPEKAFGRRIPAEDLPFRIELDDLREKVDNMLGYRKKIDHALDRIAAIEKRLEIDTKIAG